MLLAFLAGLGTTAQAQIRRGGAPEATGPGAAPRSNASIVGHVLTPDSNSPVRAADVLAVSRNGRRVSTTTDENGAYQLERLTEGEWLVTASKGGYVTWQFGQRRPYQTPPPIALKRGERFTADIPLTRGGAISGRVYDPTGDALAGLQVRVYRATMEQGTRRLKAVGVPDMTDDTGSYRVYGLPPGDYFVAASLRVAPLRFDRRDDLLTHLLSGHRQSVRGAADQAWTRRRGVSHVPAALTSIHSNIRRRAERCWRACGRISQSRLGGIGAWSADRCRGRDPIRRDVHACRCLARALRSESDAAR